jgi:DNA-3-methyladenine glycosylase
MRPGRRLSPRFFERSPVVVAPELLGCLLVRRLEDGTRLIGRLVEVEAYLGDGSDPSAHSHRGQTARNKSMFGPPGRLYAYRSYGIHTCVNVVCRPAGIGAGVLLRAAEPLSAESAMRGHRGLASDADRRLIASGPGRLAEAFGLGLEHDGTPLVGSPLAVHRPPAGSAPVEATAGPRIGIRLAADLPYRFHVTGDRYVSGPRSRPPAARPRAGSAAAARTARPGR